MLALEAAEFLAAASAAGVIGNESYACVRALAGWMSSRLGWRDGVALEGVVLAEPDEAALAELLAEAREEWQPVAPVQVTATQNVSAGGDINAPVVNQAVVRRSDD